MAPIGTRPRLSSAHLRRGDTYAQLAAGFGIGIATASRYRVGLSTYWPPAPHLWPRERVAEYLLAARLKQLRERSAARTEKPASWTERLPELAARPLGGDTAVIA